MVDEFGISIVEVVSSLAGVYDRGAVQEGMIDESLQNDLQKTLPMTTADKRISSK